MENLCRGIVIGLTTGMIIGAVAVAKDKKLANKIKGYISGASEKFEEAKEMLEEKIQEVNELKESMSSSNSSQSSLESKEMNKKSKN